MAEENPQSKGQVISLQNISNNFLRALQRHYDLCAYNLSASLANDEGKYNTVSEMPRIVPYRETRMDFSTVKEYVHGWFLRHSINDLIGMTAACMDNCHLLCTLIANNEIAQGDDKKAFEELINQKQNAFARSDLQGKFEAFEKEFGVICSLEDAIINMGISLHALLRNDGVVSAEEVDENGELVFEFKTLQIIQPLKEGDKPETRLVETRRSFKVGDTIDLTNSEIMSLNITVASFFHELFKAVDEFGVKMLGKKGKNGEANA